MGTPATPGIFFRRGTTFQKASVDSVIISNVFDDIPIFIIRLVEESGGKIIGTVATSGKLGRASAICSLTTCRAAQMSVPGLNHRTTDDNPSTVLERKTESPGTPLSVCSSGMVISSSTSTVDIPGDSVWISTFGGANSGKTSTGILRS